MNIVSTIAAAAIAIGAVATTAEVEHVQRALIIGGEEVPVNSKQYMVGIRNLPDGNTFCNGALIAPNLVLTSGYCMRFNPEYVSVGTHYHAGVEDGEQIKINSTVSRIESTNSEETSYDITVLILERPSQYPYVTLPAPYAPVEPSTLVKAMGWGFTTYPDFDPSSVLRSAELEVQNNADCGLPSFDSGATDLCAKGATDKFVCHGDIGAPLVVEGYDGDSSDVVVGLSNSDGDCTKNLPTPFTAVSTAVDWIRDIMAKNPVTTI